MATEPPSLSAEAWRPLNPFDRDPQYRDNPYPRLNHARELHPVVRTELGDYQIFRHADVVRGSWSRVSRPRSG